MISIIVYISILGVLIIVHEFGHFMMAKKSGVRVEKFSLGFGPMLFKRKKGHTEYSISVIPLGGYVKMCGDTPEECKGKPYEFYSQPVFSRAAIIFCGPLLNYILGILLLWFIFCVGFPAATTKIGGVSDDMGAKAAGLLAGDKIISIDNKKVALWEELQKIIYEKSGQKRVKIAYLRQGKEFSVEVNLKVKEFNDIFGKKRSLALLGIMQSDETVILKFGALKSLVMSAQRTWELTTLTYEGLWYLVTGKLSFREAMTGPVGIFFITSRAAKLGFIPVLYLTAVLSVSLGIFNLLPLPVLDGGHLFFLAVEKIRGKRLSVKADNIVTNIGLTLIICIALFATYNDIMKNFGDKISKLFIK